MRVDYMRCCYDYETPIHGTYKTSFINRELSIYAAYYIFIAYSEKPIVFSLGESVYLQVDGLTCVC